jgi:putative NIF3 family GTP cyclohydrolase 1 type 2
MRTVGTWVNWDRTVDRVIVGSAETEVTDAAVAWIPSYKALRKALEMRCQLFITHEPTFYSHQNELEHMAEWPGAEEKKEFIQQNGLTILRNHDTWDNMPEVGIPWAWAEFLGIEGEPEASRPYLNVYAIEETTLEELARSVAARTASIGEPFVEVAGEPDLPVRHVGIGTGCGCSPRSYREMGADAGIVCDDGVSYWQAVQWALDQGFGIVCVNHCTSEEPGVAAMARYLAEQFPEVNFHHIPQGCRYRLVPSPS